MLECFASFKKMVNAHERSIVRRQCTISELRHDQCFNTSFVHQLLYLALIAMLYEINNHPSCFLLIDISCYLRLEDLDQSCLQNFFNVLGIPTGSNAGKDFEGF